MLRLKLKDLEEALRNPIKYIHIERSNNKPEIHYSPSYYNVLRDTIFKYHKLENDIDGALDYLQQRLEKFKTESRKQDVIDKFNWYVQRGLDSSNTIFKYRYNIVIKPSNDSQFEWSGEVSRLDIRLDNGFEAWIFRNKNPEGWGNELRMPLIQNELSNRLNTPLSEISIGIYSFEERFIEHRCYSAHNVTKATRRLQDLSLAFG